MTVRYSAHAMKRMQERSIDQNGVEGVLHRPVEVVETRLGRRMALGETKSATIVVVFEVAQRRLFSRHRIQDR